MIIEITILFNRGNCAAILRTNKIRATEKTFFLKKEKIFQCAFREGNFYVKQGA